MFKPIPGCSDYLANSNGEIQDLDGNLTFQDKFEIELSLFGKTYTNTKLWFGLMAHFEMFLPEGLEKSLESIRFVKLQGKMGVTRCGYRPIFDHPVYYGYLRIVPSIPHLAVSFEGDRVVDIKSGRDLPLRYQENGYIEVDSYIPDRQRNSSIVLHRLVAEAWVKNTKPTVRTVVNHKDGNK